MQDGKYIYSYKVIDGETGEILSSEQKIRWNGWKGESYKYRYNAKALKVFLDCGISLKKQELALFWRLCELMNVENLFLRQLPKKKYTSVIEAEPLTRLEIFEASGFCKTTFDRAWKGLRDKDVLRKIQVGELEAWAVNPVIAVKFSYMPLFLYVGFKDYVDNFLSKNVKRKYESILEEKLIKGEQFI